MVAAGGLSGRLFPSMVAAGEGNSPQWCQQQQGYSLQWKQQEGYSPKWCQQEG